MALFIVSLPPWLRLVGVRTSYIYFSNISWTPWVLDPITNPFLGPSSWLHPASWSHNLCVYTSILLISEENFSSLGQFSYVQLRQIPAIFLKTHCLAWVQLSISQKLFFFSVRLSLLSSKLCDCVSSAFTQENILKVLHVLSYRK